MKCREIRYACFVTKFPLRTFFVPSNKFWYAVVSFLFLKIFFLFFLNFISNPLFRRVWFNFYVFVNFPVLLQLLNSSFISQWSEKMLAIISILNLLRFVLWLTYGPSQKLFQVQLRRMRVLFCWIECSVMSVGQFGLYYCLNPWFIYSLPSLFVIVESGIFKFPTLIGVLFIFPLALLVFALCIQLLYYQVHKYLKWLWFLIVLIPLSYIMTFSPF